MLRGKLEEDKFSAIVMKKVVSLYRFTTLNFCFDYDIIKRRTPLFDIQNYQNYSAEEGTI